MGISNPTFPLVGKTLKVILQSNRNDMAKCIPVAGDGGSSLDALESLFQKASVGVYNTNVVVQANSVYAYDKVTFASFVNNDTVTVNGTVFTGKTSPSGILQFGIGASDTITAANFVAILNAHTTEKFRVYATSALAVATIYCIEPGTIGNLCTLAISAHGSVTGANFTNGTDGTQGMSGHGL